MKHMDMQLSSRAQQFSNVIASAICTDQQGGVLALEAGMLLAMQQLQGALHRKSSVFIVGNGGSAAVASHAQIDFLNVAKLKAQVIHEPSVLTCMTNDYGYDNAYAKILKTLLMPDDILIAISSSGKSKNICNAVAAAHSAGAIVITLTGFLPDNPLRQLGNLNYWLDSDDYGFIEIGHQFVLHNLSDRFSLMQVVIACDAVCDVLR